MSVRKHPFYDRWWKLKNKKLLCEKWMDFKNFINDFPDNVVKISRIDNSLPYSLENIVFHYKTDESVLVRKSRILREFHKNNPTKQRDYKLNDLYGITLENYNTMLAQQHGVCKICGKPEKVKFNGVTKSLAVDHCHKTGKVRGLLCQACNKALGLFNDDITILQNAINYLQES